MAQARQPHPPGPGEAPSRPPRSHAPPAPCTGDGGPGPEIAGSATDAGEVAEVTESVAAVAALTETDALDLLRHGEIELEGRLIDASNTTLRAVITRHDVVARCVYKPVRGERPLWDFPFGTLADREVAAYLVSAATGWRLVPPTVLRSGPLGPGMCQLWIDEERQDEPLLGFVPARRIPPRWHRVVGARDDTGRAYALAHADDPRLARMAVFDAVINNADRKGAHVIPTVDGEVFGVDHGVCFHTDDKLRTVLWGWAGEPLPEEARDTLDRLRDDLVAGLCATLAEHLTAAELSQLLVRVDRLLTTGCFPVPGDGWPAIPWPPV